MKIQGTPQGLFATFSETDSFSFERELTKQGYRNVAGSDEVGRGPLAGPVVAASVILPLDCVFDKYDDSKKLSAKVREKLFDELKEINAVIGVGSVSESKIDQINILQASLLAMQESLSLLSVCPDFVLVDGKFKIPVSIPQLPLVKGDSRSASIAAASIVAKVTRDKLMGEYHKQFPVYNFKNNKGYATAEHRAAIVKYGPCPIHRKTFARVKEYL
jgi:ribonuclease HII